MSDPGIDPAAKSMDEIVALCKRRGFIYPASEIYGGINGFWDYGPLGVQLKNNVRDLWWKAMVECPPIGPDGDPLQIVGLDSAIIQNPKAWVASGHVAGFNDPMVDDKETKQRFRADHLVGFFLLPADLDGRDFIQLTPREMINRFPVAATIVASNASEAAQQAIESPKRLEFSPAMPFRVKRVDFEDEDDVEFQLAGMRIVRLHSATQTALAVAIPLDIKKEINDFLASDWAKIPSPFTGQAGTLTEPRMFNLMFVTYVGALQSEESKAYLRPETAQGIFLNYRNVLDTTRVKVPFGIAQVGKAFRNEVTPRNFVFRSREFEQMEMEWFCHPSEARQWKEFWQDQRMNWYRSLGLSDENLTFREHETDELSHYAKKGYGTVDVEYRWPFTSPGFGELEGIAHRTDFDLHAHAEHSGAKLEYFDQERNERYFPHVIEPAAGLTRTVLAVICEAFTPTPDRSGSKYILKFAPAVAPIKAGIFPLVNKDGMPEVARDLYMKLRGRFRVEYDPKQSIGKRYARMDEVGTPYCFTIDGQTLTDQTVTVRDRDTAGQHRIALDQVQAFLTEKIGV